MLIRQIVQTHSSRRVVDGSAGGWVEPDAGTGWCNRRDVVEYGAVFIHLVRRGKITGEKVHGELS